MDGGSDPSATDGRGELPYNAPESAGGTASEGAEELEPATAGAAADSAAAFRGAAEYSSADSPGAGGRENPASGATPAPSPAVMVTDGVRHTIPLDRIFSGGPPRDGIPSIDDPVFAAADHDGISDGDVVLGVEIDGEARAYPLSILVWHEIVNDAVGGTMISVTYCPPVLHQPGI